jgi:hypothetical protein
MLVWMNLPALIVTNNAFWAMLLTGLIWNAISTFYVFRLSADLFSVRVGLMAAALFAFHETSIAGSYTAWAQLWLPGFYAITVFALWRWRITGRGVYVAIAGVVATAAFMTHFGAVLLYPAMLVVALMIGARWQWRWLLMGAIGVLALMAPYLLFEVDRDFVDLRSFLSRDTLVDQQDMDAIAYLKPEGGPLAPPYDGPAPQAAQPETPSTTQASDAVATSPQAPATTQANAPRSTFDRILDFALSIPEQFRYAFWLMFRISPEGLGPLEPVGMAIYHLMSAIFIGGSGMAIVQFGLHLRRQGLRRFQQICVETWSGRMVTLLTFLLVIQAGFVATRTPPWEQPTYYPGFISIQLIMIAAALDALISQIVQQKRLQVGLLVTSVAMMAAVGGFDRVGRILSYDDSQHSPLNAWLYRHVDAAADYIAEDWQGGDSLTVSYDIMPEMRNYWWIVPWSNIDPAYTMGLPYDYLLAQQHGLTNTNTNPIGWADDADYIVVWEPGLSRHDVTDYEVAQFGTVYVLRPIE